MAPRTRIFGAVPNVPDTFWTDTPAAADVGHTGQFHVVGNQLVCGSREQPLVHLGHTRHHDGLYGLGVGFEFYPDVGCNVNILGFVAYIRDLEFPPPLLSGLLEVRILP